jgi:hypothetical protein
MKKILSILIIAFLVFSGIGSIAHSFRIGETHKTIKVNLSTFSIKERNDEYIEVSIKGSSYVMNPGKPILPKIVKTLDLEFGAKNVKIEVTPKAVKEYNIEKEICPAPAMLPLISIKSEAAVKFLKDEKVYASNKLYPPKWFSYRVGCGLNDKMERVTHVVIDFFPLRYAPSSGKLYFAKNAEIRVYYDKPTTPDPFPENAAYDLVIIAPSKFSDELQRLVDHKNNHGVKTILKTTEEIYEQYNGVDKPEKIKYFIKDAIENWGIKYVLLVGGLKSTIWAKPRDDANQGSRDWYVPVRYSNIFDNPKYPLDEASIHDPGVIADLYYADIYREGGEFEDWDPNDDGFFAAWNRPGVENDTDIDFYPDVCLGRLACRSLKEVKTVVDKIINYESTPRDSSWFKKMIVFSGDGFLDQEDLNIQWDTKSLPDGKYTIYAQSFNPDGKSGPMDIINITLDRSVETSISFNHDDHLRIHSYPGLPMAEIVSISEGDVLGNTDYTYTPTEREAYCNNFNPWANISYIDGVLTIRGKSYDPRPYGNVTNIHVWVTNENGEVVFSEWRNNTEMYYEGEWTTGEKALFGRGGALYYMPTDFKREIIWTSNGKLNGQSDVIEALNQGCGFAFFSGHGSPNVWADHYPGIPGNRQHASVVGLRVINFKWVFPFLSSPAFPIDTLSNGEKLPITVVGGCHNSQFNVSAIPAAADVLHYLFDFIPKKTLWAYAPVPECFSWRLISNPKGGAIATIGNTGLGYGMPGKECTSGGGDAWITIEFFRQYGAEEHDILGEAYTQTLISYIDNFDMTDLEAGHPKTVHEWVLLGDPSLKIGGYT